MWDKYTKCILLHALATNKAKNKFQYSLSQAVPHDWEKALCPQLGHVTLT